MQTDFISSFKVKTRVCAGESSDLRILSPGVELHPAPTSKVTKPGYLHPNPTTASGYSRPHPSRSHCEMEKAAVDLSRHNVAEKVKTQRHDAHLPIRQRTKNLKIAL